MARRFVAAVGLIAMLGVAAPASADTPKSEKAAVDARIAALEAQIASSKAQEGVLTSQLSAVTTELGGAQASVDTAEVDVSEYEAELTAAQTRLAALTARVEAQAHRLDLLRSEYAKAVGILEARVRAAYIDEPPDVVSFVVSASSFDEVIDSVELLSRISAQDRQIAAQVESARDAAAVQRRLTSDTRRLQAAAVAEIASRTAEARAARDRLAEERDRLAAVQSLEQSALTGTRESRADYLQEVEALEAQGAALAARIRDAQTGAESSGTARPSTGFIWPCDGVVTSGFGMRWGRMHEGIDIGCAYGAQVRAAAAGSVIYAGWFGGYGNLVVIDHGNGLSTAYAHASSILVSVGQSVSQGQTVSLVGSTGHSTGPHLHFEVRVNGQAVDPLSYL
jgi:murein DD-endopeptidase MepM/ murein hydrolase activator NlpD